MTRVFKRRTPLSNEVLKERAKKYRVTRSFIWVDPYPEVPGTKPEKIVYAELMARGIPFIFQSDLHIVLPDYDLLGNDWYKPDFVLTDLNIILEVQGAYWHTSPEQIDKDSYKYALYTLMGYKVILWWDYDIEAKIDDLFASEALLGFRNKPISVVQRSDKQEYADGKAKNGARINRRKPWTKDATRTKVKGRKLRKVRDVR